MPYGALYSATKHAIDGYTEALDHELRNWGIRAVLVEPAYTNTSFNANVLEPDAKLDAYAEIRAEVGRRMQEMMAVAEGPEVVAEAVLKAVRAKRPKLRYPSGGLAARLRLLRAFAPSGVSRAGGQNDLRSSRQIGHPI
jgi:short-subunit dehydrogenase